METESKMKKCRVKNVSDRIKEHVSKRVNDEIMLV